MGSTFNDNHEFNDYEYEKIFEQSISSISVMWNTMVTSSQSKVNYFEHLCNFGLLQELFFSRAMSSQKLLAVNQS